MQIADPDAIAEPETGYLALMFPVDEFVDVVLPRIDWPAPATRPAFTQGSIAGVPAKLYIDTTGAATVFVLAAYLDDLLSRSRCPREDRCRGRLRGDPADAALGRAERRPTTS